MTIQDIMQVGVGMPDRERFENFARDLLGFSASRSPDGSVTYLRPDQYPHRIAAYTAPEPVLQYIGFDVSGRRQLAEWKIKLTSEGIDWRRSGPKECAERHVTDFIEFNDPNGHALALSYGFEVDKELTGGTDGGTLLTSWNYSDSGAPFGFFREDIPLR